MSANMTDILGYHPATKRVIAEDCDGNLFQGDPSLVAELVATGDKKDYAKRVCIHAMLHHDEGWRWQEYQPSSPGLFRASIKQFNKERYGFPVWAKHDSNDLTVILGQ